MGKFGVIEGGFRIEEAAEKLGISRWTLKSLIDEGAIEIVEISKRNRFITQKAIDSFIASRTKPAIASPRTRRVRENDTAAIIDALR